MVAAIQFRYEPPTSEWLVPRATLALHEISPSGALIVLPGSDQGENFVCFNRKGCDWAVLLNCTRARCGANCGLAREALVLLALSDENRYAVSGTKVQLRRQTGEAATGEEYR